MHYPTRQVFDQLLADDCTARKRGVTNCRELEFSNQIIKTKQDGTDRLRFQQQRYAERLSASRSRLQRSTVHGELAVVVHYPTRQVFDQLLADDCTARKRGVTNRRELEFSNQIIKTKQDGTDRLRFQQQRYAERGFARPMTPGLSSMGVGSNWTVLQSNSNRRQCFT